MLYNEYLENRTPYQEYGYWFLLERKHACLFYEPGKGKTYPTVDAIRDVDKAKNGNAKVLILSTADAVKNMWNAEIEPQGILPKNTVIMSFTSAIQDKTKLKLLGIQWDVIVIDECHKIKSHNSQISKLVFMLTRKVEYVWGLSGTPRGNSDLDIFCQFHNMHISEWGDIKYTQFVQQCCILDNKFFGGRMIQQPVGIKEQYQAGWQRNIAMYTQRVEYDEDDNMPELNISTVHIPYKPTREYLQAEQGVISVGDYETTMTKLAAITKLHQAVNGFLYIGDGIESQRDVHHINYNDKLDWINCHLGEEPTVIVYRFAEDLNQLKHFVHRSWTEDINAFKKGEAQILFLQCSRCESFNLQMCKQMIFYTLDYSYIKYKQMLHRVWRKGQVDATNVYVLVFMDTVEDNIWKAVQNKQKLADLFMSIKGAI